MHATLFEFALANRYDDVVLMVAGALGVISYDASVAFIGLIHQVHYFHNIYVCMCKVNAFVLFW